MTKKRSKVAKKGHETRRYKRYLEDERQRTETPFRYHAKKLAGAGLTLFKKAKKDLKW